MRGRLALTINWRKIGATLFRRARQALPFAISFGLIGFLIWKVTPHKLVEAFSLGYWPWLVAISVVELICVFTWDIVCLWWLFSQPDHPLPFRAVFRARTDSIIWSAVNLEIGQAVFAYRLAKARHEPVLEALGRCAVLALFDFGTLQSLALIGSFLVTDPWIEKLRWMCIVSVPGLILLAIFLREMPERWREWLAERSWGSWIRWWNWRDSVTLYVLRLVMFLMMFAYVGACLAVCRLPVTIRQVFGVVPFVLIAESLPGTGGLGEREFALVTLMHFSGNDVPVVLSFGLIWSAVTVLGRVLIGLASEVLPRRQGAEDASAGSSKQRPVRHAG